VTPRRVAIEDPERLVVAADEFVARTFHAFDSPDADAR
jgi:hypothetical protein